MTQAEDIIQRNQHLKNEASNFRDVWQQVSDYMVPRKGQITTERSPGERQTLQIFDTTAGESSLVFAAGLLSQLVPPGEIWARFESANKDAGEEEKQWWDKATKTTLEAIYGSNFYLAIHEAFLDLGTFCTAGIHLDEGSKRSLLNYCSMPVGSYVIAEDNEGAVDTLIREWKWTARQAEQQFGADALGPLMSKALAGKTPAEREQKFTMLHAIYPRKAGEYREGKAEASARPWASCYVCVEDKKLVEEGGFYEQPFGVCRLMRSNMEVYGRGPGMDILPEVKLVNRMEYDILLALEKATNPGWLMPEDSAYKPDNRPGGVTFWDATNPNNKPEREKVESRIDLAEQKTEQKRERIRRAFFVDMFQMLNRPEVLKRDMTAMQVGEMVQEKLLLFAPFFARITIEQLGPLLERTFMILLRANQFDQPPADMSGVFKIVYTSKIALAIKAAQDNALVEMLNLCSLMTPFDQSVPMAVKWRDAFKATARNRGLPSTLLRDDEEIDAMIAQQQQAAAAMQGLQAAKAGAGIVKDLDAQEDVKQAVKGAG
jgi:hypothetical protein